MDSQQILEIFPEINEIADKDMREKCAGAWVLGANEGGWTTPGALRALPFVMKELVECPVTLVEHVHSVTATAKLLYQQFDAAYGALMKAERDIVVAGALLHDVGKLLEYTKSDLGYGYSKSADLLRHPLAGALIAQKCGLPDKVVHIIATHSFEGAQSYKTLESFIVRNADWLNFDYLSQKYKSTMTHK